MRVFFISDQTGITTEKLGRALLGKFPNVEFFYETFPFSDNREKIQNIMILAKQYFLEDKKKPIIVSSITNLELRILLKAEYVSHLDFFEAFISKLESELSIRAILDSNKIHGIGDEERYKNRIAAIDFAVGNDDGMKYQNYNNADVIIIGVSRVGKTPTSIYLAVNYGIKAANYPLVENDLLTGELPKNLSIFHKKLFGLTIDPYKLQNIRANRVPNSTYSDAKTCNLEVNAAEKIMSFNKIPYLDTSTRSIEELAAAIMQYIKIQKIKDSNLS